MRRPCSPKPYENDKRELFQLLVAQAPAVLWSIDTSLRFTSSFGAGLKLLNLVPDQLIGTSLFKYFNTTNPDFTPILHHRKALEGKSSVYEFAWKNRLFHSHICPLRGPKGTIIGALGMAFDITERKRAEESLAESLAQMQKLAGRLQSIREEERRRIALDIHDRLGQTLTELKLDLSFLSLRSVQKGEDHRRFQQAFHSLDYAIQTVREISTGLRPAILDGLGLKAAIEWQTGKFESQTGIRCRLKLPAQDPRLNPEKSTAVFRVFQELLTNITRHARAKRMNASLSFTPTHLTLIVKDNGRGISKKKLSDPASFGLMGMKERAMAFGGTISFKGTTGKGTTATLILPYVLPADDRKRS